MDRDVSLTWMAIRGNATRSCARVSKVFRPRICAAAHLEQELRVKHHQAINLGQEFERKPWIQHELEEQAE